jgi:CBS domain-containing protein
MARTVREVMTSDPVTLEAESTLVDAARAMQRHDIGDVLVTRNGQLHGILTDRDIVVRAIAEDRPSSSRVGDIVSADPMTVSPDDPVDRAIGLMRDNAIRRLPVVEGGRPVGIVSLGDLAEDRDPQSVLGQISSASPTH